MWWRYKLYQENVSQEKPKRKQQSFYYIAKIDNVNGSPVRYVTDLKIIKDDGQWVKCSCKGYKKSRVDGFKTKVWTSFDEEMKIRKSSFKEGKEKLLVVI